MHTEYTSLRVYEEPVSVSHLRRGILFSFLMGASIVLAWPNVARADATADQAGSAASTRLEEIVVTAQKQAERLQDVPVPVSVLDTRALADIGKTRLEDYFYQTPGMAYNTDDTGASRVTLRGLYQGGVTNPTTAFTVDDLPYGSTSIGGGGYYTPQIDGTDLARVEVLRGPQGTLYGANSLGGLIKYVTIDPSTSALGGQFQAGASTVSHSAQTGYNASGALNVPMTDTLAVRASGFTHQDPGYIDDPVLGINGINESINSGGRLAGLWRPSDAFSLKLSAFYQRHYAYGSGAGEALPGLSQLQQNFLPNTGYLDFKEQGYSALIHARIGVTELTSVTGYNSRKIANSSDFLGLAGLFGPFNELAFGPSVPNNSTGIAIPLTVQTSKLTQELRLNVPLGKVDWLVGLFFTHETGSQTDDTQAVSYSSGQVVGHWWYFDYNQPYFEKAAFTNLTVHFTDKFDVQFGGRVSHIDQVYNETDSGPYVTFFLGQPSPYMYPTSRATANPATFLFTPRYKFSEDLMAYLRVASGYRVGGPNAGASAFGLPETFAPDKTLNYELGLKAEALEHRVSFDASLYYIDWKNIQISEINEFGYPYTGNGSRAVSKGLELQGEAKATQDLTIAGWVVFADAHLTQDLPDSTGVYGLAGSPLPYTARFSANLAADYEHALTARLTGFLGATESYLSDRMGDFPLVPPTTPPRQRYGGFATTDVHAGMRLDRWTVQLFGTNIFDRRAVVSGGLPPAGIGAPLEFRYIQPREIGLNLSAKF